MLCKPRDYGLFHSGLCLQMRTRWSENFWKGNDDLCNCTTSWAKHLKHIKLFPTTISEYQLLEILKGLKKKNSLRTPVGSEDWKKWFRIRLILTSARKELSKELDINPSYLLSRIFRVNIWEHVFVGEYIRNINESKKQKNSCILQAIPYGLLFFSGFSDQSHFTWGFSKKQA